MEIDVEAPKVIGDVFESVAGAILVDSGMNIEVVWKVYFPLLENFLQKVHQVLLSTLILHNPACNSNYCSNSPSKRTFGNSTVRKV